MKLLYIFFIHAAIAQLVEHVICNLGVQGSSPCGGFIQEIGYGEFPEWSKGADCKSVGSSFVGPNPSLPINRCRLMAPFFLPFIVLYTSKKREIIV